MTERENYNAVEFDKVATEAVDALQRISTTAEDTFESAFKPLRKTALQRFPTLFILAITFGVSAVLYGMDQIISTTPFLSGHPWVSIFVGVFILAVTGQLYKKLG